MRVRVRAPMSARIRLRRLHSVGVNPGGVIVGWNRERPWADKWQGALDVCNDIYATYHGTRTDLNNVAAKLRIEDFADVCWEVREALQKASLITDAEARDLDDRASYPNLCIMRDLSNTDKHSGRDGKKPHASVCEFHQPPPGEGKYRVTLTIEYDDDNHASHRIDALRSDGWGTWRVARPLCR